ncbi:NAD(P)-binding domain-containing protein (plasmid) [Methylobacterium currus]|uniref:NAD(P)-dependent oxidoreductase n=1 Tax=Methylobacterium currus TaxID=2051553 RepID=UPI001E5D2859|nr:NAD(P)-dependent oxidoreductase [Methylobacterium currus]UHC19861.1 NAD(P)-binding domain-containing protein [Methylobacterium currus]
MSAPREAGVSVPRRVAVVGLGEVGTVFARTLLAQGVAVAVASRDSPRAARAADALGLPLVPPAEAASGADIVLLTVTGEGMPAVAAGILPHLAPDTLVADCTAAAPLQVRDVAGRVGRGFVDVAIMGAVSLHGAATPLLAAGPEAGRLADLLNPLGFRVEARPAARVGDASALKLLRSVFTKGLDAVVVEAMLGAERLGLRADLVGLLADYDRAPLSDHIAMYLRTHPTHAGRRMVEMEEAASQLDALGVPSLTTRAAIARYRRTVALARTTALPDGALDADAGIAWLARAEAAGTEDADA